MGFQHLTEDERKKIAEKGGRARRSQAVKKAWDNARLIKEQYVSEKKSAAELAKEYGVNQRMVYRIAESNDD